ncbi:copine-3-like isoform X3 [Mercenaria mercenaria]|uniref:copine-3-like isoform X3 n=1 Tax=Mercenaria mercenaria TaxID=6596 RepID=UPI00234F8AD9|nr:copine-3-like isoform X3 [Mercenaria mercenaria]
MAAPGMASPPMSKVELRISCRKLINKDIISKSDPCAVLYVNQGTQWIEHGRTENVQNSLDPDFAKAFSIDYMFEEVQKVKVAVYDLDNSTPQLEDDDFLGQIECTLGQIVVASPFQKQLVLKNGKPAGEGKILIRSEEVNEGGEVAVCTFKARKLENKDFLGKSDPYLEILRGNPDGSWQVVHRTEVVKNNLNPHWRPFTIPVHTLCGGDKSKPVKFDVYDWDSDGSHDMIGGFTVSVKDLEASIGKEFPCVNEHKKAKKKKYVNSGFVIVDSFRVKKAPSFLEFIYGGMQINFTVGVDFTGSNGDPTSPVSLHYINPNQPNEYMQAIQAVGAVCQDYDTDKMFPALGFGARIPPDNKVSHEFAMNFNPQNPFCAGIQGVVQAYQNCVPQIQLWGPTNVSPIIHHVAKFAEAAQKEEQSKGAHAYFVLLLLTDGVITDMDNTRRAIVHASALPMSLIIVGVGGADFADMEMLDGDDGVLKAPNGQPVHRDIVQFVPFRDFKRVSDASSAAELAKNVLAEVPQQVIHYYNWRGMQPNQPIPQTT